MEPYKKRCCKVISMLSIGVWIKKEKKISDQLSRPSKLSNQQFAYEGRCADIFLFYKTGPKLHLALYFKTKNQQDDRRFTFSFLNGAIFAMNWSLVNIESVLNTTTPKFIF